MKEYQVSKHNLAQFMTDIELELDDTTLLLVSTQNASTGSWGMARLWRAWMSKTGQYMASQGCVMPLMLNSEGGHYGERPFNPDDAHELFTSRWLGVDSEGARLSWSKAGRDGMRPATKGERFNAMRQHECWCVDKGITLFKPRDSEYSELEREQNS